MIGLFTDQDHAIGFGALQDTHCHQALFAGQSGIAAIKADEVIKAIDKIIYEPPFPPPCPGIDASGDK